jgi:hypothetical protein
VLQLLPRERLTGLFATKDNVHFISLAGFRQASTHKPEICAARCPALSAITAQHTALFFHCLHFFEPGKCLVRATNLNNPLDLMLRHPFLLTQCRGNLPGGFPYLLYFLAHCAPPHKPVLQPVEMLLPT